MDLKCEGCSHARGTVTDETETRYRSEIRLNRCSPLRGTITISTSLTAISPSGWTAARLYAGLKQLCLTCPLLVCSLLCERRSTVHGTETPASLEIHNRTGERDAHPCAGERSVLSVYSMSRGRLIEKDPIRARCVPGITRRHWPGLTERMRTVQERAHVLMRGSRVKVEKARTRERIRRKRRLHVVRGRSWLASVRRAAEKRARRLMHKSAELE